MWHLLALSLLLLGCATTDSAEWKEEHLPHEQEIWRNCSLEKDGAELAGKGWCYQGLECINHWYSRKKCRPKPYHCAYQDLECMKKHRLDQKALVFLPDFQ